jgi:hypothetical protein
MSTAANIQKMIIQEAAQVQVFPLEWNILLFCLCGLFGINTNGELSPSSLVKREPRKKMDVGEFSAPSVKELREILQELRQHSPSETDQDLDGIHFQLLADPIGPSQCWCFSKQQVISIA